MKKKSTSQSAFFDRRLLIGSFILLAFLLGLGVFFNASAQVNGDSKFAQWNPLVWLEQKVTANDGTANSYFGSAAALNGSTALIGADGDNSFQGAAYLFTKSNGSWSEGQKLTASDGTAGANFGNTVALNGSTALIGADASTVGSNTYQGKAYLFTESGGNWSQSDTFIASDGAVDDYFGAALAWDGAIALISTPHPVINGNAWQGAAYFYEQSAPPTPTPTPTPSATPPPTATPTPTVTPTPSTTPRPTSTPTATPRARPRPRPTPHARPTP